MERLEGGFGLHFKFKIMNNKVIRLGILLILVSIILGAFGAHGLKGKVSGERLLSFETGVRYMMYHGLAFLIIGFNFLNFQKLKWPIFFIIQGVLLFSCSIFLLATQEITGIDFSFLGPVTPIGGLFMIIGWIILLFQRKYD